MLRDWFSRAIVCAVVLGATALKAQCPDGSPPPCGAPRRVSAARVVPSPDARARRFLLLPFRNVTRVSAQDWLVTGAPLMLGESLGQFTDLAVVSEEKLNAARRRLSIRADSQPDAAQLRRLAEETDGWTAVRGDVYATGRKLRITVQAIDASTSKVLTRATTEIAVDADVRQAFDSLTAMLVAPTGARGARADLAALTTQSADAYRSYARGVEFMQRSAFRRAQAAFTEAVTLDSTFALAWSRLAYSSVNANILTMIDPASPMLRAVEQSVRYGQRLPPRQLEFLRATQNFLRGQTARARYTLDSLAATDRDDLDAREQLAGLEVGDFDLATTPGAPRLATSMNRAMLRTREVLERDPGRRNVFYAPAMGYALGGGWFMGVRPAMRGPFGSFLAMLTKLMLAGPDATFVPVVGDSILLEPLAEFAQRTPVERARLRRRSADAGAEWVERWLVAGPTDAEAHSWASRYADLRDDPARALRELEIADSLGMESAWESPAQRRLALLVRGERYAAASALADSMLRSGRFTQRSPAPGLDRGRGYGMTSFLIQKRWAEAGAAATAIPARTAGRPACAVALGELATETGEAGGAALRAMTDTVARYIASVAGVPALVTCLDSLVLLVNDSTAGRRTFAGAALLAAADSLQGAGNTELALRAARWAAAMDTLRRTELEKRPWYRAHEGNTKSSTEPHSFIGGTSMEVRDSNGNLLTTGDSVMVIKDLKVKGSSVTLKRGTVIKNIRLTGDAGAIECNADKVKGLVLKTEFLKKV